MIWRETALWMTASFMAVAVVDGRQPIFLLEERSELVATAEDQFVRIFGNNGEKPRMRNKFKEEDGTSILSTAKTKQLHKILAQMPTEHRQLRNTGHLAALIAQGCSASAVYGETSYDDTYSPICECLQNQNTGLVTLECNLRDEACDGEVCTITNELFYFSDDDGDLTTKATCSFCSSEDCEGVADTCTSVLFDDEFDPQACQVATLPRNDTETTETCSDCVICGTGSDASPFGISHTCFDEPTDGCDTDQFAHVHNFLPKRIGNTNVPGTFQQTCEANAIDRVLYDPVSYEESYSIICDCDDPTSGVINCDLHDKACFANLCTDISEVFYFSEFTGDYEYKYTINWETTFWTEVYFEPTTGTPTSCSVISPDPFTGQLFLCENCQICTDEATGETGISYNCFGRNPDNCDTTDGRTAFNLALESSTSPPPPTASPTRAPASTVEPAASPTGPAPPTQDEIDEDDKGPSVTSGVKRNKCVDFVLAGLAAGIALV